MKRRLGRLLAWGVTLALLTYLFTKVPLSQVLREMQRAPWWTAPVLAVLVFVVYLADALAIWRTFGWFVARLSFREVLAVRGATYLLALVNYAIGQGALVYFVNRSRGVPVLRGAAAVLLIMGINLLLLLFMATGGLFLAEEIPSWLRPIVVTGYIGLAVYVALVVAKPRWLSERAIFDVLMGAGVRGHLKAMAIRLPHIGSLVLCSTVSLYALGVEVPLAQAILGLPLVYLVTVLPISVQGVGPSQTMLILLFARYAPGPDVESRAAVVIASSFLAQGIAFLVQLSIGVVCLRTAAARRLQDVPATPLQASA